MIFIATLLTPDEKNKVTEFLKKVKALLAVNDCHIANNRKNGDFDRQYPLRHQEKIEILKSLTADDCISIEANDNSRYVDSEVYKFLINITLTPYGEIEDIDLYIKMYILDYGYYEKVIVISFHKEGIYE